MKKYFYLLLSTTLLSSCTSIIMNTLIKDARVENTASIKKFQLDNKFDTSFSFIAKADTATAMKWIEKGLSSFDIYNTKGERLDFIGNTGCGGLQFDYFLQSHLDSFKINNTNTLQKVLDSCYNYQNKKTILKNLPITDFYIVVYWSKFAGKKFGYKENVTEMENEIKNDTLKKHSITLLKINTDLQESWGMQPKGKMSVKLKVKKREGNFVFGALPIKK